LPISLYHDQITWTLPFEVTAEDYGVSGKILMQTCNDRTCIDNTQEFALGAPAAGPDPEAPTRAVAQAAAPPMPGESPLPGAAEAEVEGANGLEPPQSLIPFLLAAIGFGFAAVFTPCVFPMIPITVSFFLKQSEKEHHQPVSMAAIYCLGIIGTFAVLGVLMSVLFGAPAMQAAANDAWLNLFFTAVLVFFALNMLGMFELRVPGWLLTWSSSKESAGGVIGVLFMAFTFTLVSFTCTFAFAGTLMVMAANGEYYRPIVGMLAFAAAFSLPFFFLALFPSYLQKLPKSGGWMNRVKVTMGLIELALAFKFLSVADFSLSASTVVFDYAFVMSAWIILALAAGMYLLGSFRLPHDSPSEDISVPRFMTALSFLGFAAYLATGLFSSEKPRGALWEVITAFAPPVFEGGEDDIGPYLDHEGLKYSLDYERAIEYAKRTQRPVFLDFTGVNCINCRKMEQLMARPQFRQRLENFVRVQLYTDVMPPPVSDPKLAELLLEKNRSLQTDWLGKADLPSYVIVTPEGRRLAEITGYNGADAFADFLDRGWSAWQGIAARGGSTEKALLPVSTAKTTAGEETDVGPVHERYGLRYALDYQRALAAGEKTGRPVILAFTGENSVRCRLMDKRLAEAGRLDDCFILCHVFVDSIPTMSGEAAEDLLRRNVALQISVMQDVSLPAYAVVTPQLEVLQRSIGLLSPDELAQVLDRINVICNGAMWVSQSRAPSR
ncbi:MAG: thioredoxin family protein, partial [Planctomycetes bacterium]|nr:thioredoxin family protein [Planctomycetota bacterium]